MKRALILYLFAPLSLLASYTPPVKPNVILMTFDGVRWREVFLGLDSSLSRSHLETIFPNLLNELAPQGVLFGHPWKETTMKVSTTVVTSLPIYQSIMAGEVQPCKTNDCGRIQVETLPERLLRELDLKPHEVATIASWDAMPLSAEHVPGTIFSNAAMEPLQDGSDDPELHALNQLQNSDPPPWGGVRYDKYTFAQALRFLKKHKPRFLFISFNDTDEYGHRGQYTQYVATLRRYDKWLNELVQTLNQLGDYGKSTSILVTTDHGRGVGTENWKHHATSIQESELTWLYGRSPFTIANQRVFHRILIEAPGTLYTHIDIRPTIEALFGLTPIDCKKCGRVIQEIAGKN